MTMKFLIVGAARSGSSYLKETLGSHPGVLMHGEPFQTANIEWHIHPSVLPEVDLSRRETDPVGFIDDLFDRDHGHAFVGMKILFGQNDNALHVFAERKDIRKIAIRRENILAQFSSFVLAKKTGIWNVREKYPEFKPKVHFESAAFRDFVEWIEARARLLEQKALADPANWTTVRYDAANPMAMATAAARFLGLQESATTPSTFERLHQSNVLARFENISDVEVALDEIGRPEWRTE